jgi:hypothetical protein
MTRSSNALNIVLEIVYTQIFVIFHFDCGCVNLIYMYTSFITDVKNQNQRTKSMCCLLSFTFEFWTHKNTPKVYKGLFATESVFPSENGFK